MNFNISKVIFIEYPELEVLILIAAARQRIAEFSQITSYPYPAIYIRIIISRNHVLVTYIYIYISKVSFLKFNHVSTWINRLPKEASFNYFCIINKILKRNPVWTSCFNFVGAHLNGLGSSKTIWHIVIGENGVNLDTGHIGQRP